MSIKYSASQMSWLKMLLVFMSFSIVLTSQAQIISGEEDANKKEEKKEKKKKEPREPINRDSLTGTTFYATGLMTYGYRSFQDNSPFGSFEEWNDQTAGTSGGFNVGLFLPLNDWLSLDLGFTYFGQKEQFNYSDPGSDSAYFNSNSYMYIGVPLRLRYTYGSKFQVFTYFGLTPLNLINIRYNENYNLANGTFFEEETTLIKDKLAIFNLMGTAGIGITYNFDWIGLTLYPEYRYNFLQTYDSSKPIDHKMFSLGVNAGMTLRF